ncbi:MAG: hypothetical protein CVT99_16300 [Bacteroidetes bacterium HGW-Bacteroidetes-16]|jgi:UDP-N-acetyl-D-mannosaminuronate dehydrogenase|nr:MAG: hypothetical protein CVT99_16300 [Bacteroidetes bacterium HGW-Bacteroidetes-16]
MKPLQHSNEVSINEISLFDASSGVFNSEDQHTIALPEEDVVVLTTNHKDFDIEFIKQHSKLIVACPVKCEFIVPAP